MSRWRQMARKLLTLIRYGREHAPNDGRVTDFLDVGVGATRWPTFNLADSFIVLGVAALALIVRHDGAQSVTGRSA